MDHTGAYIAVAAARIILGVLFLFQGYDKIFRIGLSNVAATTTTELQRTGMSRGLIKAGVYFNSCAELVCGFLLVLGLLKLFTLSLLTLNMIFVATAMSLISPFWKMEDYFPRLAMLLLLLMAEKDIFSLDHLLQNQY